MDNNIISQDTLAKPQCVKCNEYEEEIGAYQILLLTVTFIGPIIGMLIGLFVGRKLK